MPIILQKIKDLPPAQVYLVAGPAASGKTTFAAKLAARMDGVVLSLDNYFVDEDAVMIEYDEKYGMALQWESPEAYDIQMLKQNLHQLIETGETHLPTYSFAANKRIGYHPLRMKSGQPLIIEGLYTIRFQDFLGGHGGAVASIFVFADKAERHNRARTRDLIERGKPAEDFEKHYHFVSLGEERWLMEQAARADFIFQTGGEFL